eukprot:scaffold649680_cov36-Prasinocladus_malaysianus.AAC.1
MGSASRAARAAERQFACVSPPATVMRPVSNDNEEPVIKASNSGRQAEAAAARRPAWLLGSLAGLSRPTRHEATSVTALASVTAVGLNSHSSSIPSSTSLSAVDDKVRASRPCKG